MWNPMFSGLQTCESSTAVAPLGHHPPGTPQQRAPAEPAPQEFRDQILDDVKERREARRLCDGGWGEQCEEVNDGIIK